MHAFYLHGFASSPRSSKATYLRERFLAHGIHLRCPDFNAPEFATLTITRMIEQLQAEVQTLAAGPVTLVGSSLGAVVAIHAAARLPDRVQRLVLLAPAVMFPRDAHRVLGADAIERWRATGTLEVFHYGSGGMQPLKYDFYEDGLRYDVSAVDVGQPTLIFQGRHDRAVNYRDVENYAATRPGTILVLTDDDHQLIASLPRIWSGMAEFLELR
jgi:uncharacterized protein